jgi:hypothetical protein
MIINDIYGMVTKLAMISNFRAASSKNVETALVSEPLPVQVPAVLIVVIVVAETTSGTTTRVHIISAEFNGVHKLNFFKIFTKNNFKFLL